MTTMRLNSQVQQFEGFGPGWVFCMNPEMPIGAARNPNLGDFMNPKGAQATKTNHLLGAIRQIRQASLTADFNGQLNLCINSRSR